MRQLGLDAGRPPAPPVLPNGQPAGKPAHCWAQKVCLPYGDAVANCCAMQKLPW